MGYKDSERKDDWCRVWCVGGKVSGSVMGGVDVGWLRLVKLVLLWMV